MINKNNLLSTLQKDNEKEIIMPMEFKNPVMNVDEFKKVYQTGGEIDSNFNKKEVAEGLGIASEAISMLDKDKESTSELDILGSAAQFAGMGAALGPVGAAVGGAIGLGLGFFKQKKEKNQIAKEQKREEERGILSQIMGIEDKKQQESVDAAKFQQDLVASVTPSKVQGKVFFQTGGMTQGAYNHKTNPLKVVDRMGNDTGMELTGGEGVFDKPAMQRIKSMSKTGDFEKLGEFVKKEMETWKIK
jgi:hypothetical protein